MAEIKHEPEIVRHKKTGDLYEVLYRGAQVRTGAPLHDYAAVVVVARDGEPVSVRPAHWIISGHDVLFGSAQIQTGKPLQSDTEVVVYRSKADSCVWVRPASEMDDGRFEAVPGKRPSGAISILEERVKAGLRYFRDGAAVRTGVLPDHASHIADVLQSLLSEFIPPRAAEPASDALTQARRLAADEAEERFRGNLAALFLSGAGDDHPWVQMALRGIQVSEGTKRAALRDGIRAGIDAAIRGIDATVLNMGGDCRRRGFQDGETGEVPCEGEEERGCTCSEALEIGARLIKNLRGADVEKIAAMAAEARP